MKIVWDGLDNKLFLASTPIFISFDLLSKDIIDGMLYISSSLSGLKLNNSMSLELFWLTIPILHSLLPSSNPTYKSLFESIIYLFFSLSSSLKLILLALQSVKLLLLLLYTKVWVSDFNFEENVIGASNMVLKLVLFIAFLVNSFFFISFLLLIIKVLPSFNE